MVMKINTNIPAINANNKLGQTTQLLNKSYAKLSSGKRINTAADGTAAMAISQELSAQLRSLGQAERNTMDGISMIQTAEGATNEVGGMLERMSELAVQAANGPLHDEVRAIRNEEFDSLKSEVDRISASSEFNGQKLLDGSADVDMQVGSASTDQINVTVGEVSTSTLGNGTEYLNTQSLTTQAGAQNALGVIEGATSSLSEVRSDLGAAQNTLSSTTRNLSVERQNIAAANSRIADVDVAAQAVEQAKNQILMQSGTAMLVQANHLPSMALSLVG